MWGRKKEKPLRVPKLVYTPSASEKLDKDPKGRERPSKGIHQNNDLNELLRMATRKVGQTSDTRTNDLYKELGKAADDWRADRWQGREYRGPSVDQINKVRREQQGDFEVVVRSMLDAPAGEAVQIINRDPCSRNVEIKVRSTGQRMWVSDAQATMEGLTNELGRGR